MSSAENDDDDDHSAGAGDVDDEAERKFIQLAGKNIQDIVQSMCDAYKKAKQVEITESVRKFCLLYPDVTSKGFQSNGNNAQEFQLVRDARCFYMVLQWNLQLDKNFRRSVRNYRSFCSSFILLFSDSYVTYCVAIRVVYGRYRYKRARALPTSLSKIWSPMKKHLKTQNVRNLGIVVIP
jgi:hypothetical protein